MRLFKMACKYFWDKGPYLVLLSILPSLLVPFLMSPSNSFYYLFNYKNIEANSFADVFLGIRSLPTNMFYIGIIGVILAIVSISVIFAIVDRHMRVGDFTLDFRRNVKGINYNILPSILYVLLVCVISEILAILLDAFFYLWAQVIYPDSPGGWLAISLFTYIGIAYLNIYLVSATILFPPFMMHMGLPIHESFKMAIRNVSKHVREIVLSLLIILIPFLVGAIIIGTIGACIGFDHIGIVVSRTILDGVAIGVMVPFFITLMYTIFYDVTGTERMDLEKVSIWNKEF